MILAIETGGPRFSVALLEGTEVVKSIRASADLLHETALAEEAERVLSACNIEVNQLSAIAVGSGPGSYSGLRIGMAFASGLSFASGVPLISAGTLENLFYQMSHLHPEADFFLSLMHARKNEYFFGLWKNGCEIPELSPKWIEEDALKSMLSTLSVGNFLVCNLNLDFFSSYQGEVAFCNVEPDAGTVGRIAWQRLNSFWERKEVHDEPEYLKPVYISGKK